MKQVKLILVAAMLGLSSAAMADTARDQRMNDALENYRSGATAAKNPSPGAYGRAEEATKRGARKAGNAVKTTAERAGKGISTGVKRTGDALKRTGEKIKEKTTGTN